MTYYGETARNIHVRSQEHYNGLKNMCKNNFMYRHIQEEHEGNIKNAEFEWGICGKFVKPVERQLSEAINIERASIAECLNSKMEYFHHNVRKIAMSNAEKEQCNSCGRKFESVNDLNDHNKQFHMRFKCSQCEYISFGEKDIKSHKIIVHMDASFKCKNCGFATEEKTRFENHTCNNDHMNK